MKYTGLCGGPAENPVTVYGAVWSSAGYPVTLYGAVWGSSRISGNRIRGCVEFSRISGNRIRGCVGFQSDIRYPYTELCGGPAGYPVTVYGAVWGSIRISGNRIRGCVGSSRISGNRIGIP